MSHDLAAGPPEAQVQRGQGKFENVLSPVLLAHGCRAPYGVEVESRFTPRPSFAGGSDPRKHLHVALELPADIASHLAAFDVQVRELSQAPGEWAPLVSERDGRYFAKVRLAVEGRPGSMRVGGELQPTTWQNLSLVLDCHNNLRGAEMDAALRPAYIWSVHGRRGLSVYLEMFAARPAAAVTRAPVDYFQ